MAPQKNTVKAKIITPAYRIYLQNLAREEEEAVERSLTSVFEKARVSGVLDISDHDLKTIPNCVYNVYKKNKKNIINENITSFKQLFAGMSIHELNLSKNKLNRLSADIGNIEPLTRLILSENSLVTIPNQIENLRRLTYLDLSGNKISELPCNFFNLANLRHLNLSKNLIVELDEGFGKLVYLELFDCRHNKLQTVPNSVGALKQLKELLLSHNYINTIPVTIGELSSLEKLELMHNCLKSLPETIGQLLNLRYLYLQNNQLTQLNSVMNCSRLLELYASNNDISKLPKRFGQSLVLLNLRKNKLKELPRDISEMKNLIRLDLSQNKIQKLPCTLGMLKFLVTLNIEGNPINAIYRDIKVVEELRTATLIKRSISAHKFKMVTQNANDQHEISLLPANHNSSLSAMRVDREFVSANFSSKGLSQLPIEFEFICQCAMDVDLMDKPACPQMPPFILQFINLKRINLSHNNLQELPTAFNVLSKLLELNISVNQFQQIPACIYKLYNLKSINAATNNINSLDFSDTGLGALTKLKTLKVNDNKITKLPMQLADLQNLTCIEIMNNPLLQPPRNVILKGTSAIKNYLKYKVRLL